MQILKERGKVHGNWGEQSEIAHTLKTAVRYYGGGWARMETQQQEALDAILIKISRILAGDPDHKDHWVDIAGYATLASNYTGTRKDRK